MNILITGGSSGLGSKIVERLASIKGNHICFTYNMSKEKAERITDQFKNTTALYCNFNEEKSVLNLIQKFEQLDIDVLIHNAFSGALEQEYFHKISPNDFRQNFEYNIMPVIQITQELIRLFRKKKFGKIINVNSTASFNKPPIGWSNYAAAKSYLLELSKSWATENIRFNITSNCVSPSFMQTKFTSTVDDRLLEEMLKNHPLKKLLTTEEVADCILFLTTCTQQINGINLVINAGADLN